MHHLIGVSLLHLYYLYLNKMLIKMNLKLLEEARNLKPAVKSTAIQSSPMCIQFYIKRAQRRKRNSF